MLFGTKAIVCGRTFLFVLRKQREGQQYPQAEDKSFQHQSYFLINSSDLYAINNAKRKSAIVLFANLTVLLHISNNMEGLFHYTSSFSLLLLICSFTAWNCWFLGVKLSVSKHETLGFSAWNYEFQAMKQIRKCRG